MVGFDTLEFVAKANEKILNYSETLPQHTYRGNSLKCQFANYQAFVNPKNWKVYFSQSIQKAVDGQNVFFDIEAQRQKLLELCDITHLNLELARVYRQDIATTIELKHNPETIFPLFVALDGFERELNGGSLYFNHYAKDGTKRNTLLLYDKVRELREKRQPVPLQCNGGNWLRLEYSTLYQSERYGKSKGLPQPYVLGAIMRNTRGTTVRGSLKKVINKIDIAKTMDITAINRWQAMAAVTRLLIGRTPTDGEINAAFKQVGKFNKSELDRFTLSKAKKKYLSLFADCESVDLKKQLLAAIDE